MCNSRSCFGVASVGAPISRSSARWFIGNSVTSRKFCGAGKQHHDAVDAGSHAAVRRRAKLEARGYMPPNRGRPPSCAIAGDLEGLAHDLRRMVADPRRGDLEAVAGDVVLVGLDRERVLDFAASSAASSPCGIENGLCEKSIFFSSSFHSYIGKSTIQASSKRSLSIRFSSCPILVRASPANLRTCRDRRRRRRPHRLRSGRSCPEALRSALLQCCWQAGQILPLPPGLSPS